MPLALLAIAVLVITVLLVPLVGLISMKQRFIRVSSIAPNGVHALSHVDHTALIHTESLLVKVCQDSINSRLQGRLEVVVSC